MTDNRISRRTLLGATAAAPALTGAAQRKRNVLFIAADDLCTRLNCYGDPASKTPNFDRLARSGVCFQNAYCQYPLCCPSRTSVMTGFAPDTTRVWDNSDHLRATRPQAVTLSQLFRKNGYFTARSGKIYHYNNPSEIGTAGFDDAASWQLAINPAGADRTRDEAQVTFHAPLDKTSGQKNSGFMPDNGKEGPARWRLGGKGPSGIRIAQDGHTPVMPMSSNGDLGTAIASFASDEQDGSQTDYMVAEAAIAIMEEHRNEPFFIATGFFKPHVPWIAPSHYFDLYPEQEIALPVFDPEELNIAPKCAYTTVPPNYRMTAQQQREATRGYYAMTSFLDAQLGRLLDAVERLGLAKDTTIVFWADHGFQLGEHGQWQKRCLFEPSIHVPMLFAGAGVTPTPQGCRRTVENLDLYPTLAEMCGLQNAPAGLQGRSLVPLLKNPDAPWDKPAVSQVTRVKQGKTFMGYSLRAEQYRYTMWGPSASEGEELYDFQSDPRGMRNLADDSGSAGAKAKLRARLGGIARSRGMASA